MGVASLCERLFHLSERGSTLRRELVGGLTTFMTMSYIIFVNPAILGAAGMPRGGAMMATCLGAAFATALMGLLANLPVALAPGMGMNAFVAYVICGQMGYSWQTALGMVFWSGVIFLVLSSVRLRETLIAAIPRGIKLGAAAGIGLFIAFIGLQHAGLVVDGSPGTLVKLGSLVERPVLVALFGIAFTAVLMALKLRGAVLLGILATGVAAALAGLLSKGESAAGGLGQTFLKLDVRGALMPSAWPAILTLLFFDMFDTVGTLMGVAEEAGLLDEKGRIPNASGALISDAAGTVVGSLFGTSTVTSYIESAAGVAAGARTGLSSVVVAVLFLIAMPLLPLVGFLGNAVIWKGAQLYPVTAPALIVVGFLMAGALRKLEWDDITEGLPAFLTMLIMPLTFSISAGLAAGFISCSILKLATGRVLSVHPLVHVISGCIVAGYVVLHLI